MYCFLNGVALDEVSNATVLFEAEGKRICLLDYSEIDMLDDSLEFKRKLSDSDNVAECASKYENHDGYDMMHINMPDGLRGKNSIRALGAYITKDEFVCAYTLWDSSDDIIQAAVGSIARNVQHQRILLNVLDQITQNDYALLDKIEDEVSEMEELPIMNWEIYFLGVNPVLFGKGLAFGTMTVAIRDARGTAGIVGWLFVSTVWAGVHVTANSGGTAVQNYVYCFVLGK